LDLAIAQSEVWSQRNAQLIAETKRKKQLHFLADLWSQSEFRTQRKSQRKTDPKSEMMHCNEMSCEQIKIDNAHIQSRNGRQRCSGVCTTWLLDIYPLSATPGRRHLRSAYRGHLNFPRVRLAIMATYGERAFAYAGPSNWNSLHAHLETTVFLSPVLSKATLRPFSSLSVAVVVVMIKFIRHNDSRRYVQKQI